MTQFISDRKALVYCDNEIHGFLFDSVIPAREAFQFITDSAPKALDPKSERSFNILYNKRLADKAGSIYVSVGAETNMASFNSFTEVKDSCESVNLTGKS